MRFNKLISKLLSGLSFMPLVFSVGYFRASACEYQFSDNQQTSVETSLNDILKDMNFSKKRDLLNVLHAAIYISQEYPNLKPDSDQFYSTVKSYVTNTNTTQFKNSIIDSPLYILSSERYEAVKEKVQKFCTEILAKCPDMTTMKDHYNNVSKTVNQTIKDKTPMDTQLALTNYLTEFNNEANQQARYPYTVADNPNHVPCSFNDVCHICNVELSPESSVIYDNPNRRLITLCCHHTFHSICYKPWLQANKTNKCPVCVQNHALDSIIHLSYDVQQIQR